MPDNEEREVTLVARFKQKEGSEKAPSATLSHLTRGLTWAPTYSLPTPTEGRAKL